MNIVSSLMQMLGSGNTLGSISSMLGMNQDQTKRATSVAVPSLLAGLTGLASTPQGAERLADTVSRQDTGILDNLTGALSPARVPGWRTRGLASSARYSGAARPRSSGVCSPDLPGRVKAPPESRWACLRLSCWGFWASSKNPWASAPRVWPVSLADRKIIFAPPCRRV